MPLASSAVAAAVSWAASGWRAGAREPAARDGSAGASRGMPRSRIRHERWVSSARGPSTAFRAVRGDEDDPGSLDEDDPPLSPARAAADPRRPSRDLRSPVEPGPSHYARPSRADVERQSSRASSKARAPNGRRRRSRKGDVATLADGAEVFLISTAVGVTAMRASERADLDARRSRARDRLRLATAAENAHLPSYEHRVAVASALADPALFAVPAGGWLADIALVAAVALGAVLRRVAKEGGPSGGDPNDEGSRKAATSESVLARVRRLESAHDRVFLAASRNARDLSKVSTRVRLVRRELSPALRKVEAESAAREAEAAALDARVRRLGDELRSSQRTVGALQGVTAKQFGALAKALTDVKGEIDSLASRARAPVDDAHMIPAEKREERRETATAIEAIEVDARGGTTTEAARGSDADDESGASEKTGSAEPVADDENKEPSFDAGGNVMRVRRRRSLTFRVGGAAKTKTRKSAEGAAAAAGDDAKGANDANDDEAASEAP